jgi:ribosomal protein L11 methyltransferase
VLDKALVEAWTDALLEAGAVSVMAEDADADSPDEQAVYGEPGMEPVALGWTRTRVLVLMHEQQDDMALLKQAALRLAQPVPADRMSRVFADDDWVRLSQSQFEPIEVFSAKGVRLLIEPSWHLEETRAPGHTEVKLTLDPGLAFGTGSHPTTSLCLGWMLDQPMAGRRMIDYGCGSGILALAAAKLGANPVIGIDIDPQALRATTHNAQINGVAVEVLPSEAKAPAPADIVVANILSSPLKVLAPLLQSLVRPGGHLVLSGLLERQIDEIIACYGACQWEVHGLREGWACLAGRKSG